MIATEVARGSSSRRVQVTGITPRDTDRAILNAALAATGETLSSLFDWDLHRFSGDETAARVQLHTD